MVASLFEILVGLSGAMGFMLRYISPIVIASTITLVGLSMFTEAIEQAGHQWVISLT